MCVWFSCSLVCLKFASICLGFPIRLGPELYSLSLCRQFGDSGLSVLPVAVCQWKVMLGSPVRRAVCQRAWFASPRVLGVAILCWLRGCWLCSRGASCYARSRSASVTPAMFVFCWFPCRAHAFLQADSCGQYRFYQCAGHDLGCFHNRVSARLCRGPVCYACVRFKDNRGWCRCSGCLYI
jgi:hypothetical protein